MAAALVRVALGMLVAWAAVVAASPIEAELLSPFFMPVITGK